MKTNALLLLFALAATPSFSQTNTKAPAGTTTTTVGVSAGMAAPSGFVPGDSVIFIDQFLQDKIGEAPKKWHATTPATVQEIKGKRWLRLRNEAEYAPKLYRTLPERYTIEFDVLVDGAPTDELGYLGNLTLTIGETADDPIVTEIVTMATYEYAKLVTEIMVKEPSTIYVSNAPSTSAGHAFNETLRTKLGQPIHVAIAVDKQRLRLWFDEELIIDQRDLMYSSKFDLFRLTIDAFTETDPGRKIMLSDMRVAAGPHDRQARLDKQGRFSTTAIVFEPGSDKLLPASDAALRDIARLLNAQSSLKLKIVSHLDRSDETDPLGLSKKRADAVREKLMKDYAIAPARLETEGKGFAEMIAKGKSEEAKANNRRIEFVKAQ